MSGYAYRKLHNLTTANLCNIYIYIIYTSAIKQRGNKNLVTVVGTDDANEVIKINLFFSEKDLGFISNFTFGGILRFQLLNVTQIANGNNTGTIAKSDLDDIGTRKGNIIYIPNIENNINQFDINKVEPISLTKTYSWEETDKKIISIMKKEWYSTLKLHWEAENQKRSTQVSAYTSTIASTVAPQNITNNNNGLSAKFSYTSIENLKVNTFVSIVAKLLDKSFPTSNAGKRANIKLWDGTGLDVAWVGDQPKLGNTIFANTWEQNLINVIDGIPTESWISITGAKVTQFKEILEIKLFKNSKIAQLSEDNLLVKTVLDNYMKRLEEDVNYNGNNNNNNNNNNNSSGSNDDDNMEYDPIYRDFKATDTHYPHIPITKISDVLAKDQTVPNKFKLNVSFSQHIPLNLQDFSRILCRACGKAAEYHDHTTNSLDQDLYSCIECGSSQVDHIFLFKLILKDETGEIPIIFSNHANYFLNMIPSNLYNSPDKLSLIENKMKILKKPNLTFDICIMSYYEVNKDRTPENVKYQAFDTKLLI